MIPRDTPRILEMSYREIFIEFFFGLSLAICALLVLAGIALMIQGVKVL